MELMARVLRDGKQVILLIPEISLTYQTVMRFYRRFGDQIAILNSVSLQENAMISGNGRRGARFP